MTAEQFRQLALKFPGAIESAHMNHPDFRLGGKIFATIGPDETWSMVKLSPEQQQSFMKKHPSVFSPCSGTWGERGATKIHLAAARKTVAQAALDTAWENASTQAKKRVRRHQA